MPMVCCVPDCTNNTLNKYVSFHRFPKKNITLRNKWVELINQHGPGNFNCWQPKKSHRICGMHFNLSGRKQRSDKIPKYWKWSQNKSVSIVTTHCFRENEPVNEIVVEDRSDMRAIAMDKGAIYPNIVQNEIEPKGTLRDHNYCVEGELLCCFNNLKKSFESAQDEIISLHKQIKGLKMKLKINGKKLLKEKRITNYLNIKVKSLEFDKTRLKSKSEAKMSPENMEEEQLKFYTAFSNKDLYWNFANLIYPGYCQLRKLEASKYSECNDKSILTFNQQMLLVLMRLRLGLLEKDLAYRFEVSQATISHIWNFWIDLLSSHLSTIPKWPSKKLVEEAMPENFKLLYPKTRVIVDCTEIFIEKPSNCNIQSVTYSSYKHHNTAKGLIGITPNGFVSFVSDLFPGRKSDKEIVLDSGFLDLIEPGDDIMADRGFLIEEEIQQRGATLNMPPFSKSGIPFTEEEDTKTKQIASLRVHVERIIRLTKCFRILKFIFPNSMASQLDSIWKVCSHLVNFIAEPLLDRTPDI